MGSSRRTKRPPPDPDRVVLQGRRPPLPPGLGERVGLKLRIWNTGFDRFAELAPLSNLVELEVMDWTEPSFEPLRGLVGLRRLTVVHFPKVVSLAPLAALTGLEALVLSTLPSWDASRQHQVVDSLAPLAGLSRLRELELGGVRARDGDLAPLGSLGRLERLALPNLYPQHAFARLARALPHVASDFLAPWVVLTGHTCGRCGADKVMLSGSDTPNPKVVCPSCQRGRVEEAAARFRDG